MRKLKKITKRFAAAALAAVMLTAQLPVNAFAAKNVEQAVPIVQRKVDYAGKL